MTDFEDLLETVAASGVHHPATTYTDRQLLRALIDKAPMRCVAVDEGHVPDGKTAHFDGKEIIVRRGAWVFTAAAAILSGMAPPEMPPLPA